MMFSIASRTVGLAAIGGGLASASGLHAQSVEARAIEHFPPLQPASFPERGGRVGRTISGTVLTGIIVEAPPGAGQWLDAETYPFAAGQPFLGQPISPDLIRRIETAVAQQYADRDEPVIAHWVPDAGVKSGIVKISVQTLVLGQVTIHGGRRGQEVYIRRRLKLRSGQAVDGARFNQGIADLNRYPFRTVEATFGPNSGKTSDLDILIRNRKPWEAYLGFKYGGSRDLTFRRYYLGGSIGNLLGADSILSFQATGSPDVALHGAAHPRFKETVTTYSLPVGRGGQIEASLDIGELNFSISPQSYRFVDIMAQVGLRRDLRPNPASGVTSDIRYGIEAKNELELILTNSLVTTRRASEVYQVYLGYHRTSLRKEHHDDLDLVLHLSPGNLDPGNSHRQALIYSEGRQRSQTYAYLGFAYDRVQPLSRRFTWHSQVAGQVASGPIPFSEQAGLGGLGLVRGYYFIDGTYDSTLVLRNELTLGRAVRPQAVKPYAFFDYGSGRDIGLNRTDMLTSTGIGARVSLGRQASLRVEAVKALRAGLFTAKGSNQILAELTLRY